MILDGDICRHFAREDKPRTVLTVLKDCDDPVILLFADILDHLLLRDRGVDDSVAILVKVSPELQVGAGRQIL